MPKAEKTPLPKSTGHRSKQPYNSGFPPPDLRSDDPNEFNFTVSSITRGSGYSSLAAMHSQPPLTVTVNNGSHSELIPTQGIVTGVDNYDLCLTEIILPSNVSVITANILNYALLDELTLFIKKYLLTVNVILTDLEIVELLNHIPNIFSDSLLKDLLANFDSLIKDFDKIKPEWASSTAEGRKLLNDHMDHINFIPRNIIGDGNIPNKCILKKFSTSQQYEYPDDICQLRLQALTTALPGRFPDPSSFTKVEAAQYAYTITVRLDVMVDRGAHYIITLRLNNPHDPRKTYTNERFNKFIVSDDFKGKVIAAIRSYPVKPEATGLNDYLCAAIQGNWGIDATKCKFVIIESGCARVNQVVDSTGKLDIILKPYDNTKYLSEDNRPYVRLFSHLKPNKVIRVFLPNDNWFNAIDQWSDKASPVIFKLNNGSDEVPSTGAVMAEGDGPTFSDVDDVRTPREHTPSVEKLQGGLASVMGDAEKLVVKVSETECRPAAAASPAAPAAPATTAMGTRTTIINRIWGWCNGALTAFTRSRSGGGGYVLRPLFHKIPTITAKRGRNDLKGRKRLNSRNGRNGRNGRKKGRKGRQMTRKVILACSHLRRSNKKLK